MNVAFATRPLMLRKQRNSGHAGTSGSCRFCCKSPRVGSVKLKFETIESARQFFGIIVACLRLFLNQCFPAEMLKRLLQQNLP